MRNAPDIHVTIVIKDKTEWEAFLDDVCRSYGFDQKLCPLVYTLQGDLVCEGSRFGEHLKQKYGISYTLTKENIKSR